MVSPVFRKLGIAASVLLLASLAALLWFNIKPSATRYQTAFSEIKEITLPDSSRVYLNANSTLLVNGNWVFPQVLFPERQQPKWKNQSDCIAGKDETRTGEERAFFLLLYLQFFHKLCVFPAALQRCTAIETLLLGNKVFHSIGPSRFKDICKLYRAIPQLCRGKRV